MALPHFAVYYLIAVNIVAAYMFWLDWRYEKHWVGVGNIPEETFLFLSLMGGAFGILLLQGALKHRTYRKRTRRKYMTAMAMQLIACSLPFTGVLSLLHH